MTDLSVDARLLATERGEAPHINSVAAIFASALMAAGALALANQYTWRQGALFLLGGALGLVLYHALFGFTSAWRVFIANGRLQWWCCCSFPCSRRAACSANPCAGSMARSARP